MHHAERCHHCGEALPAGPRIDAAFGGARVAVCCAGCAAAVELIDRGGFGAWYSHRSGYGSRPPATAADWSAYDRPALAAALVEPLPDGGRRLSVLLEGVRCAACAWLIERALGAERGLRLVRLDPLAGRLTLELGPTAPPLSALFARLAALGFQPHPDPAAGDARDAAERRTLLKRLAVAGLAAMQAMMYSATLWGEGAGAMAPATRAFIEQVGLLLALPVVLYSAQPFRRGAARELAHRRIGMDSTIALAVLLAFGASAWNTLRGAWPVYYDALSMFVFLLLAGRYLELAARARAGDVAGALAGLLPLTAQRIEAGVPRTVGRIELAPGDRVLVAPGAVVPADARLLDVAAELDEALLSGESRPVPRAPGEELVAGSINRGAPFEALVLRVGAQSLTARIGAAVARAQAEHPPTVALADRIAPWAALGAFVLAALAAAWWWSAGAPQALAVAIAVLVATCPCALGLATPAALACATGALARRGLFVTRGRALDALADATDVVFDKTGTLTLGRPELVAVEVLRPGLSAEAATALAAALERGSEHALARAFPPSARVATRVTVQPGAGIVGEVDGRMLRLGAEGWIGAAAPAAAVADDATTALLADATGPLARFRFRDGLRGDAATTVATLRARGLTLHLWSGDRAAAVARVAGALGIDDARAELLPEAKLAALRELQAAGRRVLVVGDGINDAPMLAGADCAVALGQGSALAAAQSDAVLAGERLGPLALALDHARRTRAVVRENLAWAFGYNVLVLPVAAAGLLLPWAAAVGMSASSLLVVANALRLRRIGALATQPAPAPRAPARPLQPRERAA